MKTYGKVHQHNIKLKTKLISKHFHSLWENIKKIRENRMPDV